MQVEKKLDRWLEELSKLNSIARLKFTRLAADYKELPGALTRAIRLPAKTAVVRSLCLSCPEALEAFDLLYKERQSSFNALLEWKEWLTHDEDLENQTNLIDADTIYEHGPERFTPRIVKRLQTEK